MRIRTFVIVAAAALALTACQPGSGSTSKDSATKRAAASPSPSESDWAGSLGTELALMDGLQKIDPGLAADQKDAAQRAEELCQDIRKKSPGVDYGFVAASVFASDKVSLTPQQGAQIVTVVKASVCQ